MVLPHPISEDLATLIARRFRIVSEPTRIRLLDCLRDGEQTVNDLAAAVGTTQQNTSKQLAVLADAAIVGRRKHGNHVYYRIVDHDVLALCEHVCGSIEKQAATLSELVAPGGRGRRGR